MGFRVSTLKGKNYNNHHIVPKERGGSDHSNNLLRLLVPNHTMIHSLFGNQLPHEQIETLLEEYNTALARGFKKDLISVLMDNEDKFYKQEVWKSHKK